jgi:hypothetical protein
MLNIVHYFILFKIIRSFGNEVETSSAKEPDWIWPFPFIHKIRETNPTTETSYNLNLTTTINNIYYNFIINKRSLLQTFRGSLTWGIQYIIYILCKPNIVTMFSWTPACSKQAPSVATQCLCWGYCSAFIKLVIMIANIARKTSCRGLSHISLIGIAI